MLTTFGSLGDLHPALAVALALRERGHEAVVATSAIHRDRVERCGIGFRAVRPDADEAQSSPEMMRLVMDRKRGGETVVRRLVMPRIRESFEDLLDVCAGADLVVGHTLTFAARLVSEVTGIPWASSVLQPLGLFSALDPPVLPSGPDFRAWPFCGPRIHRGLFRLARWMTRRWVEPWHRLRAELGLAATRENPVFEGQHSPALVLALFSKVFAPPQPDWPAATVQTGFPFFDADGPSELAPELQRFLDAGPPPIVFTLGSSAVLTPGAFFDVAVAATRHLGARAVLLVGRESAWNPGTLPADLGVFDYAPYSLLFPRAAAIVHQGGIGTTAQAMRAGRPMLVMPFAHDQPDNAARATRLGVARTLPKPDSSPKAVARELERLLGDPQFARRAAAVAEIVRAEDGAHTAAGAIESFALRAPSRRARQGRETA